MKNIFIKFKTCPDLGTISSDVDKIVKLFKGVFDSEEKLFSLEIILKELLNNIAEHGTKNYIKKKFSNNSIEIKLKSSKKNLLIEVKDKGKAWCLPFNKYLKEKETDLFSSRGRGVMIIDQLSECYMLKRIKNYNVSTIKLSI